MNDAAITFGDTDARRSSAVEERRLSSRAIGAALSGMVLFAVGASLFLLPQSLRLDEAQSLWQSGRTPQGVLQVVAEDVHVPLYHELLHFWRLSMVGLGIGDTVESARALSLLFLVLSIPAMYALGAEAYGKRIGLLSAMLVAFSPFTLWYGSEIRMYSLFLLFTILNQWCFLLILKRGGVWAWIGYALTSVIGMYAHYFFALNFLGQGIFYVFNKRAFAQKRGTLLRFIAVAVLVIVTFAPWAWFVYHTGKAINQQPLLSRPTAIDLFNAFSQFFFGFQDDATNTIILSLWPLAVVGAFLTLRDRARMGPVTTYLALSAFISFAVAFGISILVRPVFVSRYLIFTLAPLYALAAIFLARFLPRMAIGGAIGVVLAMLAVQIVNPATPVKEEYRAASDFLTSHATAQDIVVLSAPFTLYPVEYYYRGVAPLATLPIWNRYETGPIPPFVPDQLDGQVKTLAGARQSMWVLLSYDQGYEETVRQYLDSHYQRTSMTPFSRDLTLYSYQLRYETPILKAKVE